MRVGLVCEGDASRSETAFSGTAKRIYTSLVDQGHTVLPVDASLQSLARLTAAAMSFALDKQQWRSNFRYGIGSSKHRTVAAEASLAGRPVDVVLQIGATYDPPASSTIPYVLYCDWNMALSIREAKATSDGSHGRDVARLETIDREHARLYKGAAAVLTISERLRQSFIELYGLPPDRVKTVYAGPNFDTQLIDQTLLEPKISPPTVLFIAKEFQRKGGDTVAAAMQAVQSKLPSTRLVFAGSQHLPVEFQSLPNVEHLGLLDKNKPAELQRLLQAYRQADVMVLPSRRDPFPTVIREAMFFGLPCVVSDIWAMPEMVEDRVNGFLVPPGDADALAARMLTLLNDPATAKTMGEAARVRAETRFSWPAVGKAISDSLLQIKG